MEVALHAEGDDQFSGLSQYDYVTTLNTREQDGRATGEMIGITITREGDINAKFSNDDSTLIAKLAMAQFANNEGLVEIGEGLYKSNFSSGEAVIYGLNDDATSSIISGALEMSNVDLAREFTDMITTQRGYQANARVITTSDQLLQELMNLKR
jgi:flagellar hook protein FlgE